MAAAETVGARAEGGHAGDVIPVGLIGATQAGADGKFLCVEGDSDEWGRCDSFGGAKSAKLVINEEGIAEVAQAPVG